MRKIEKIILHCSDSSFGDADIIDSWHKERGWSGNGYNYILLNGYRKKGVYIKEDDGLVEVGRDLEKIPAHCKGQNRNSIGICLIGEKLFSGNQLYKTLPYILTTLMNQYGLTKNDIYAHYEFSTKTCPNIDIEMIKELL